MSTIMNRSHMKPPRTGLEAFLTRIDPEFPSYAAWRSYPFMLDGRVIATNVHILVEVPETDLAISEGAPPEILERIRGWLAVPIPEANYMDLLKLPDFDPCVLCNGSGLVEGRAGTTCEECDGYGERQKRIQVGNAKFCIRYLRLLSSLPGIKFAPAGEKERAAFKFDGGRGFLMPMRDS